MKPTQLSCVVAVVTVLGVTTGTGAEPIGLVGGWLQSIEPSQSAGKRHIILMRPSRQANTIIGFRCAEGRTTLAVAHDDASYRYGAAYTVKFRADEGPIVDFDGFAVNDRTLQITDAARLLSNAIRTKAIALRVETSPEVFEDLTFDMGNATAAFAEFLADCPLGAVDGSAGAKPD